MSRRFSEKTKALLDAETGAVYKDHNNRLRFALAFPNLYRIGMSTLGMQIVYRIINEQPDALAERVFLPDPEDVKEHERTGARLFAMESQAPVDEFDVFAFSISFEMDYVHVLEMLRLAGLPLRSSERDETHPLVLAGGPAVTFNPEPLADFLDAVVIGEAEDVVPEVTQILKEHQTGSRRELLEKLASLEGVYVPSLYTPAYNADGTIGSLEVEPHAPVRVLRRRTEDLSSHNGTALIVTPNCEFPNMLLTEAIRGCSRQCRFCVAGYTSLPPRPRDVEGIAGSAARVGLVGSAVFDNPQAFSICEGILDSGREFSVSSVRMETLTPELAQMMYTAGQRTMTIAPEAGSERLRRVINKILTDEDIYRAVGMAVDAGFGRVKLYYMLGLPGEGDADIDAMGGLASGLTSRFPGVHFQFSASCYVPKPWTPFQWCGMTDEKTLSARISRLKGLLKRIRKVDVSCESPRMAKMQALLARGDRRLSEFLEKASAAGGNYARALSDASVDVDFYTARTRSEDEVFPWDHLDMRVRKDYLRSELKKAFELKATTACKVGLCQRCGVC